MKFFTIAVALSLLLALQSALAAETAAPADALPAPVVAEADALSEQLILEHDIPEPLPAREEKLAPSKKPQSKEEAGEDAPLMADSAEGAADALAEMLAAKPAAAPGTLDYDMDTVDMLADAPASLEGDEPASSVAKR